jgi:hypothetical protein
MSVLEDYKISLTHISLSRKNALARFITKINSFINYTKYSEKKGFTKKVIFFFSEYILNELFRRNS